MTARFYVEGASVYDRKDNRIVCGARSARWAELVADGLNLIVDEVTPLVPSVRHIDVLDGEVVERQPPAIEAQSHSWPADPAWLVRQRAMNMDLENR